MTGALIAAIEYPKAFVVALVTVLVVISIAIIVSFLNPVDNRPVNHIYGNPGGNVWEFMADYQEMRVNNERLAVHGLCASACTYFLNIVPKENVCADDSARFGFHGVYAGILGFNAGLTKFYHSIVYPEHVNELLAERGFDGTRDVDIGEHPSGLIWLTAEELDIQPCVS